jgi:hypothetical protein
MRAAKWLLIGMMFGNASRGDGLTWYRSPKICGKGSPHLVGDPVNISNPKASSWSTSEDFAYSTGRGVFKFRTTRVGAVEALGQIHPAHAQLACQRSVLYGLKPPFGASESTIHSLMALVDTRCTALTRVMSRDGDIRFFVGSPIWLPLLPVKGGAGQAWVPRAAEAAGEPSRLLVKRSSAGKLSFEWYSEDGERLLFEEQINSGQGVTGSFRLTKAFDSQGIEQFSVQYGDAMPVSQNEIGAPALSCGGAPQPLAINFRNAKSLRLEYNGLSTGNECVLREVKAEPVNNNETTFFKI